MSASSPLAVPSKRWETAPKVIVWDVDDTLVLERDFARSGFAAVGEWLASERSVAGFYSEAWQAFERGVRGTIFNEALSRLDHPQADTALIKELVRIYREHEPNIHLLGDAEGAIRQAQINDIAMAVITDGPPAMQANKVKALDIEDIADPVVLAWTKGKEFGKPHPSAFVQVQQHLKASGSELVYIADNPMKDFVAPRELGWRTVRVRRRFGLHTDVPSGDDVDCEVTSLTNVLELLGVE